MYTWLAEDIGNWRETVGRLISGEVMDVRGARQVGSLVGEMSRQGLRVMSTGEGLAQGRRLNNPLVGKLLVGRRYDAQSWWGFIAPWHARSLRGELGTTVLILAVVGAIAFGRLLLKPCLDNAPLLFPNIDALLQMFLHDGILSHEPRG
jgi:hypothetical protein